MTINPLELPGVYRYAAVDVETSNGSPDDLNRHYLQTFAPHLRVKSDETRGQKVREAFEKKAEKLALLPQAPVIIIAMKSDGETRLLHICEQHEPRTEHGALIEGFGSPAEMLVAFRNVLERHVTPETPLVGHNVLAFDFPKLRWQFVKHGVRLPEALLSRDQVIYDTMRAYCAQFTTEKDKQFMVSLEDCLEDFGLPNHKAAISGKQVPELYKAGEFNLLYQYALLDVHAEADLFLRMTGQAHGLK